VKTHRPPPISSGCGSQHTLVQSVRSRINLGNDCHVMQTQRDPDYTTGAHRSSRLLRQPLQAMRNIHTRSQRREKEHFKYSLRVHIV
jgi:hypothetical protein